MKMVSHITVMIHFSSISSDKYLDFEQIDAATRKRNRMAKYDDLNNVDDGLIMMPKDAIDIMHDREEIMNRKEAKRIHQVIIHSTARGCWYKLTYTTKL